MTLETWLVFVAAEIVLILTPGPAVLFVISHGLRFGRVSALWANLGILSANAIYFGLSAIGLGAILLASHDLFTAVRLAGAAYLIWLGITTFFGRGMALSADPGAAAEITGPRVLLRGIALQGSNPKALLFFTAFLPQFIRLGPDAAFQVLVLGATSTVLEFVLLAGYGTFAGLASQKAREPRFAQLTSRVSGVMLIGAGAGLGLAGGR